MTRKDRLAAWLRPEDIGPALRLLDVYERYGQTYRRGAEGWRRRITGWAMFHGVDEEARQNA